MDPTAITELPNLGTIAGVSLATVFFVYLLKKGWPEMGGWKAVVAALAIGVALSFAGFFLSEAPPSAQAVVRAVLNGLFGGGGAALAARAVRSQPPA